MRLVRLGPAGSETPGVLVDDDTFVDLSDVVGDFDEKFFGSGALATSATSSRSASPPAAPSPSASAASAHRSRARTRSCASG